MDCKYCGAFKEEAHYPDCDRPVSIVECLKCGNRNPVNFVYGAVTKKDILAHAFGLNYTNPLGEILEQVIVCKVCDKSTLVEYRITLKGYNKL